MVKQQPQKTDVTKKTRKRQNIAKKSRLATKSRKELSLRSQRRWGMRVIIISITLVLAGCIFYLMLGRNLEAQANLSQYLKKRYDKDFVVDIPYIEASGFAVPGRWKANAHPKDDSTLQFNVGQFREDGYFFDTYDNAVWAREERPRVETLLKDIYATVPSFDLNIGISMSEKDPIKGDVPNIDVALKEYSDIFIYHLTVKTSAGSVSGSTKETYKGQFKKIAQYILEKNVKSPSLGFVFYMRDENASYVCNLDSSELSSPDLTLDKCLSEKVIGRVQ